MRRKSKSKKGRSSKVKSLTKELAKVDKLLEKVAEPSALNEGKYFLGFRIIERNHNQIYEW